MQQLQPICVQVEAKIMGLARKALLSRQNAALVFLDEDYVFWAQSGKSSKEAGDQREKSHHRSSGNELQR